jgi:uncharacterized membrane protein HdeD (DUF308 family)
MTTAATLDDTREAAGAGRFWWVLLVTGTLWIVFGIVILRFDWTTVASIAALFGIVMLAAAGMEVFALFVSRGWWRVAHAALALVFLVVGIVSFIHPGNTFAALAAVMSFAFIAKGIFDLVVGIIGDLEHRWLSIVLGLLEIGLGFWAAGNFGNAVILLVVWVGLTALFHGISEIILAFMVRSAAQ